MPTEKPITRILLIDDDPEEYDIFQTAIHEIDTAISVFHLNTFVKDFISSSIHTYDLVFLDINMPVMDGFEWILKIREAGSSVPVIMYSTTMNQSRINKSYESGANLFLPKPDNFNALIQSIEQILGFNWVKPEEITQRFFQKGIYFPFISETNETGVPNLMGVNRLPKAC